MKRKIINIENAIVHISGAGDICMTQHEIADLLECFVVKINANVRSILKSEVLDEIKACRTYTYKNGNSVEQYNLEMIIALSFRNRSYHADTFREFVVRKTTLTLSLLFHHFYKLL
jgi:hypothetical protein